MTPPRKPILGIVGGIGAGKSFVSRVLGSLGCLVIDSDQQARDAFADATVVAQLRTLFGDDVLRPGGSVDRKLVGARIFRSPELRLRLEAIVHPFIAQQRDATMRAHANDARVRAFVWDSPLLFEAGLDGSCDAILFVDTPRAERLKRVQSRGWDDAELTRREASQMPLDEKRRRSTHIVPGDADEAALRAALAAVLDEVVRPM